MKKILEEYSKHHTLAHLPSDVVEAFHRAYSDVDDERRKSAPRTEFGNDDFGDALKRLLLEHCRVQEATARSGGSPLAVTQALFQLCSECEPDPTEPRLHVFPRGA